MADSSGLQRRPASSGEGALHAGRLVEALARGDVGASFRPVVHLGTGTVVGWQAVARWDDEHLGPRHGSDVTDVASENGLLGPVELAVLAAALTGLAGADLGTGAGRPTVTVRLCAATLLGEGLPGGGLVECVKAAFARSGVSPRRLVLAVDEGVEPHRIAELAQRLRELRALEVRVALADVACIESFSRIRGLPFDRLDLGTCCAARIGESTEQAIVRSLLALARDLAVDVVVDGIDDQEQHRVFRRLGCTFGTGRVFGEPLRVPSRPPTGVGVPGSSVPVRRGYPVPADEVTRLGTLYDSGLLDSGCETVFDDIVREAAAMCDAPVAMVALVDVERVFFKAAVGLGDIRQVSRNLSFCGYAICRTDTMVVPDALVDARFRDNPLVADDPRLRFYAGAPIVSSDGTALGTVCVIDHRPRELDPVKIAGLERLARHAASHVELRARLHQLERARQDGDVALHALDELRRMVGSVAVAGRQG